VPLDLGFLECGDSRRFGFPFDVPAIEKGKPKRRGSPHSKKEENNLVRVSTRQE
jgi:hypothetical protein